MAWLQGTARGEPNSVSEEAEARSHPSLNQERRPDSCEEARTQPSDEIQCRPMPWDPGRGGNPPLPSWAGARSLCLDHPLRPSSIGN